MAPCLFFSHGFLFWALSETVNYAIVGDYILQDFGGEDASYLSREDFDKLRSGRGFSGGWPEVLVHCKAGVRPAGGLERFTFMHMYR